MSLLTNSERAKAAGDALRTYCLITRLGTRLHELDDREKQEVWRDLVGDLQHFARLELGLGVDTRADMLQRAVAMSETETNEDEDYPK